MLYFSTRDTSASPKTVSAAEAVKEGLAPDGGLYLPVSVPRLKREDFSALCAMEYAERTARLLSLFFEEYDRDLLLADCREAYSAARFPRARIPASFGERPAPLCPLKDGVYALELWHGPTSAFKDMALQIMPRLLSRALRLTGEKRLAHILVATSGDTGKAALEGYRDVDGVKITVFYPTGGVSPMQARQMQTTRGGNVNAVAVRGNFDDAQNGVKKIFSDRALAEKADREGFFFSSANSINWGRLAPQIAYYVSAYCDLINAGKISMGDPVNVAVPTGNFGNIFAAYLAREAGLPVSRLICASNRNDVLTEFVRTGVYDRRREFHKTVSPSMDILISSNLERLLCFLGGPELTRDLMGALTRDGVYRAPESLMEKIRAVFSGYSLGEDETLAVIGKTWAEEGYLTDPHTAVGYGAVRKYREETGDSLPVILASTASPFKFAAPVSRAIGLEADEGGLYDGLKKLAAFTGWEIPAPLADTETLPLRFERVIDPRDMALIPFGG